MPLLLLLGLFTATATPALASASHQVVAARGAEAHMAAGHEHVRLGRVQTNHARVVRALRLVVLIRPLVELDGACCRRHGTVRGG